MARGWYIPDEEIPRLVIPRKLTSDRIHREFLTAHSSLNGRGPAGLLGTAVPLLSGVSGSAGRHGHGRCGCHGGPVLLSQ